VRKPVIAGNWKMHKSIAESVATVAALAEATAGVEHCEIVVAPTFVALPAVAARLAGTGIGVAGQDVAAEPGSGAFTGEVSATMLVDAGASHCIIGHSERRQYYGETDASVNRKIRAALAAGLIPIVCVGETLEERDAGAAEEVVGRQLGGAYAGLTGLEVSRSIAAYEPVWAIGTGRTATPDVAQQMHAYARGVVEQMVGADVAGGLRILYGGSVKPDNIAGLMAQPDIDGGLVGGASLEVASFVQLVMYKE
jgi:triosephosphate isomerase